MAYEPVYAHGEEEGLFVEITTTNTTTTTTTKHKTPRINAESEKNIKYP